MERASDKVSLLTIEQRDASIITRNISVIRFDPLIQDRNNVQRRIVNLKNYFLLRNNEC